MGVDDLVMGYPNMLTPNLCEFYTRRKLKGDLEGGTKFILLEKIGLYDFKIAG